MGTGEGEREGPGADDAEDSDAEENEDSESGNGEAEKVSDVALMLEPPLQQRRHTLVVLDNQNFHRPSLRTIHEETLKWPRPLQRPSTSSQCVRLLSPRSVA